MKEKVRVVDTTEFLDTLCELLETTERVPLLISGSSMTPFLVHCRDMVYLSPPTRPLRRGDMALYRRDNGAYVLHRVVRQEPEGYCMVGDAQTQLEHGIRPDQIRGVVVEVERKGRRQGPGSFWWEFFAKVWIRVIPLRPHLMKIYTGLKRRGNGG